MEEYSLSVKQYRALKMMPDDINKDVTSIRQIELPEGGYIDNKDFRLRVLSMGYVGYVR